MSANRQWARLSLGLVALVAACQAVTGVVPPSEMRLAALNSTTQPVVVVVNGEIVMHLQPGQEADMAATDLPKLPWMAEVRLPTGRSLLSLTVRPGDVVRGPSTLKGAAARVDLSCGRIDLWSGLPLLGPAPASGTPGECDP